MIVFNTIKTQGKKILKIYGTPIIFRYKIFFKVHHENFVAISK